MVSATLEMPETATRPVPAVVVLHGSGGIDGRGEFHAKALRKVGYATLEVFMFEPGNRFKEGHISTLTHDYGALAYLEGRRDIIPAKIGALGFSCSVIPSSGARSRERILRSASMTSRLTTIGI